MFLVSLALAHAPLTPAAAPSDPPGRVAQSPLAAAFRASADEAGVPEPILAALAWEATRFGPDVVSTWGGWSMFDLREGDEDPSLEHAAALLEIDPNVVARDWRVSIRGAAAILADQARASNGGVAPDPTDLPAWYDAVRAFSGRHEPKLQDLYARYIYESVEAGIYADTPLGVVAFEPVPGASTWMTARAVPPPGTTDSALASGWYGACADNYSDYSRGSGDIDMVVIHTVQGSYSGCQAWFANCTAGASAHYVIRSSDGEITQMVRESDVAWHAGHWTTNTRSVGIEHEGYVSDPGRWYTDAMYASSAQLTIDIAARQGVSLDRSSIIGHVEVPGCSGSGGGAGCHTDPGTGWDWDYFMTLVNGGTATVGGTIIGAVRDTDIYNGPNLVGATVWIEQTGETTIVADDGFYRFEDVPFGTYTMRATYPGYAEGTCTKSTSSATDWCSIALVPSTTDDTDVPADTGAQDTDPPDTAADTDLPAADDVPTDLLPGRRVGLDGLGGCVHAGAGGGLWALLTAVPLALLRRRRA